MSATAVLGHEWRRAGRAALACGDYAAAYNAYGKHCSYLPNDVRGWRGRGVAAWMLALPEDAELAFATAVALDAAHDDVRYWLGRCLLARGVWSLGWSYCESRPHFELSDATRCAPWQGQPIAGAPLYLLGEQGFGDMIQFARFVGIAKRRARAGSIYLVCPDRLHRLLSTVDDVDGCIAPEHCPIAANWAWLLSLPHILGLGGENLCCAVPYLRSFASPRVSMYAVGRHRSVGVAWSGNPSNELDHIRSMPFHIFATIFHDYDGEIVVLDPKAIDEQQWVDERWKFLPDLGSRDGYADTTRVIGQLDAVVTVDTSLLHLAGAMSIPTIALLSCPADCRWGTSGGTTVWYPSVQLIRQPAPGDWSSVVSEAKRALSRY